MSIAFGFLGLLDLIICALVFNICVSQSSDSKLMVDRQTKKVYVINQSIPHAGRVVSKAITDSFVEDDNTVDEGELRARMASFSLEDLGELGWEAMIVS